ncbi:hypothetical protein MNBD_ALPHA06-1479 [hydrothermal vent metagenome]|uniref:JmjC domain-containing protein n=1 Tax=hydrothermal vent metagenome TaxID=652676 RepID=A0A3B0SIU0_9ZZZZ
MELINNWSDDNRENYGKQVMAVQHSLNETGLFTDEALAAMLDKHPSHLLDVLALPDDERFQEYKDQQITVDFTGASGKTLIEAAKAGDIWINAREVMNTHAEYIEVLEQLHDELSERTGKNLDRQKSRGGVLISSPTAKTPYHVDPTITHLWHIRGQKRAWVYPLGEEFCSDKSFEAIVLGESDEDCPFEAKYDEQAQVFDLTGGEMVSWPHRSPHRVENQSYCISMVMEFSTKQSAFINSGMLTNGLLRRRLGMNPSWEHASQMEQVIKSVAGRVLRKIGAHNSFRRIDMVKFKLDENAKGFIRPVTPYKRAF